MKLKPFGYVDDYLKNQDSMAHYSLSLHFGINKLTFSK